jgi:hypothetical protein
MFVVLSVESVSYHLSNAWNFEVASRFLENLFTLSLMVIFKSLNRIVIMYIVCGASNFFIDVKGISYWKCVRTGVPESKRLGIIADAYKEQLSAAGSEN